MISPFLPYGRQYIDDDDIAEVAAVLRSGWLTTGPAVDRFEQELAGAVGAAHVVVCNSGTAALYLAARSVGLSDGEAVIVPAVTFAASASAFVLAGHDVILADVDPETGLMLPAHVDEALTRAGGRRVGAVVPVHLRGEVGDPEGIGALACERGLSVIEDACHALGTTYGSAPYKVGSCAHSRAACFSFHPVKTIAMGEGGAVVTNDAVMAASMRRMRSHGISREPQDFLATAQAFASDGTPNAWYYEIDEINHNLRASDIQCALASSQLRKLGWFISERQRLVAHYRERLAALAPAVRPVITSPSGTVGWHLMSVLVDFDAIGIERNVVMTRLRQSGIGTQVHYIPIHMQPYYRRRLGPLTLPGAEAYYQRVLSLPLYVGLTEADIHRVVAALAEAIAG